MRLLIAIVLAMQLPWALGRRWRGAEDFATLLDPEGMRAAGVVLGILLAAGMAQLALLFATRRIRPLWDRRERWLALYAACALMAAAWGLRRGNPAVFVAGGLYQMLALPAAFLLTRYLAAAHQLDSLRAWITVALATPMLLELAAAFLTGDFLRSRYSGSTHFLLLLFVFPAVCHRRGAGKLALVLAALLAMTLSLSVSAIAAIVIALVVYLLLLSQRARRLRPALLALAAVAVAGLFVSRSSLAFEGGTVQEQWRLRWETALEQGTDYYSVLQRWNEAEAAVATGSAASAWFGAGLGAHYQDDLGPDFISDERHYVHLLAAALFLRVGALGALLAAGAIGSLVAGALGEARRAPPGAPASTAAGAALAFLGALLLAQSASSAFFIWAPLLGIFAAIPGVASLPCAEPQPATSYWRNTLARAAQI